MGKRSSFERRGADYYPTPKAAVVPLIPYLRVIHTFAEPCAGDGALVRHLESFGLRCVYAGDIRTGQDALAVEQYGAIDCIITNPPYDTAHRRKLMHALIEHFQTHCTNLAVTGLRTGRRPGRRRRSCPTARTSWQSAALNGSRARSIPARTTTPGTSSISSIRAVQASAGVTRARRFLHGAPGCASNAARLTSRGDPVLGSARRRAGSAPIARGLA